MASGKLWKPCSQVPGGGTPVRTRTHHGRVGDEIGNPLRCRCLLGIVGGRPANDRRGRGHGGEDHGGGAPVPRRRVHAELAANSSQLHREGFWWRPGWPELRHRKRPPESTSEQYWAFSVSDSHIRKTTVLLARSAASRAHLQSGHNSGATVTHAPQFP